MSDVCKWERSGLYEIYETLASLLSLVKNESHLMTDLPSKGSFSRKALDLLVPSCCFVRIIIKVHRGKLVTAEAWLKAQVFFFFF